MSGLTDQKLDDKGRWIVPVDLREPLGVHFWLTLDADSNMVAIPNGRWEELKQTWENQLKSQALDDHAVDAIDRTLLYAVEINASKDWRTPLPERIRQKAELKKDLVTVGNLDRVVVWDRDRFLRIEKERYEDPETLRKQRLVLRGAPLADPQKANPVDNGNTATSHSGDGR